MTDRKLTDAEILGQLPEARAREDRERRRGLRARSARYDRSTERVVLELTNGFAFAFPVRSLRALRRATVSQRARVDLDGSGGVVRWKELDVDLSVPGLLLSALGASERRRHLARIAGRATSEAKAEAARRNGAKGGRPRAAAPRSRAG